MSKTYKTRGINLNGMPMGESDRLLTILSPEYGLIRAIAPGARKYKSSLRGRSQLFVINDLLIVKGKSLDRITQAETQESYPKLSQDLGKLTVSQYLAELVLYLGLSDQPQTELYSLLTEHLKRIETLSTNFQILPHLVHAIFHILAIAGIAPKLFNCCLSEKKLIPNFEQGNFKIGFSFYLGGLILLSQKKSHQRINYQVDALELTLLQSLSYQTLPNCKDMIPSEINSSAIENSWIKIQKMIEDYIEFYLGRSLKTAKILNSILTI